MLLNKTLQLNGGLGEAAGEMPEELSFPLRDMASLDKVELILEDKAKFKSVVRIITRWLVEDINHSFFDKPF